MFVIGKVAIWYELSIGGEQEYVNDDVDHADLSTE
jgi:hypothetical protein